MKQKLRILMMIKATKRDNSCQSYYIGSKAHTVMHIINNRCAFTDNTDSMNVKVTLIMNSIIALFIIN